VSGCVDFISEEVQVGEIDCAAEFISYVDPATSTAYFTNTILGETTSLLWSFGDGKFSTTENPVHPFPGEGIYAVGLNTYDFNTKCMDFYQENLLIGGLGIDCEADFIYRADATNPDVIFSNKSIGDIVGSVWSFGDNSENSTDTNPTHIYPKGGYYYVCLSVTNSSDTRNMTCKWVLVEGNTAEDCRANFMYSVDDAKLKATFVDNSFGNINKFTWDFGDSRPDSVSIIEDPIHTYDRKGYYLVHLKAENTASGCVSSEYKLLNIGEVQVLKASFGYEARDPDKKVSGYPVDLVSASSGDGATVEWDFGDKQIKKETQSFTVMDSTSGIVTHYYEKPGKYQVCVRITDIVSGQTDQYCQWVFTKFAVGLDAVIPSEISLNVFPNPFIQYTTITYSLEKQQFIEMAVFDQLGRRVETLVKSSMDAGSHQIEWETKSISPGVYHLKVITQDGIITKQLIIAK
jgi:PKD repeat protein